MVRYIAEDDDEFLTIQEPPPRGYLTLISGGQLSHSFPLRGEIQLGRDKHNAIVIADQKVSRHHATLDPIDNTYIIHDQGSANGTYVNGVLIAQPTRLKNNDKVGIGDTTFLYTFHQPDAEAAAIGSPSSSKSFSPASSLPVESASSSNLTSMIRTDNTSLWLVIGCMALVIMALLFMVAMFFGLFVGLSQSGLVLEGVAGIVGTILVTSG